jgi:O-antigen ligase
MVRVYIALGEIWQSPLIGFGAESFGQENPAPYAGPFGHIGVLSVTVLYESGIVGATALALGFALLLASLWVSARRSAVQHDVKGVGAAAAFIASLVCMLVAYQVSDAMQFGVNWIIVGAASALAVSKASVVPEGSHD